MLGLLTNRQPVVDDDSEDKVPEDALKKLGLLWNYSLLFIDFFAFWNWLHLILMLCHIRTWHRSIVDSVDVLWSKAYVGMIWLWNTSCLFVSYRYHCYWHCSYNMQTSRAGSINWHGVLPPVCPSMGPLQQTYCCRFAGMCPGRQEIWIDCCSSSWRIRAVPHRHLNTDLF